MRSLFVYYYLLFFASVGNALNTECTAFYNFGTKVEVHRPYSKLLLETLFDETTLDVLPQNVNPFRYEKELSLSSGLPLDDVVGIARNFFGHRPGLHNSIGAYHSRGEVQFHSGNLLLAFKNGIETIEPGSISLHEIVQLRTDAISSVRANRGTEVIREIPLRYHQPLSSTPR